MVDEQRWLLLIHQLPPKPDYFRVKIWRRLQRLGSVAIKNSVYVLPKNDQTQEDFQWVLREIVEGGGEASLCEARFVEGLSDDQVEALFQAARGAEYDQVAEEARRLAEMPLPDGPVEETRRTQLEIDLARLQPARRHAEMDRFEEIDVAGGIADRAEADEQTEVTWKPRVPGLREHRVGSPGRIAGGQCIEVERVSDHDLVGAGIVLADLGR